MSKWIQLAVVAFAIAGCNFRYQGDPGTSLDVWNQTGSPIIVQILPAASERCFEIMADELTAVFGSTGVKPPPFWLFVDGADYPETVSPKGQSVLLVVRDDRLEEIELSYRQGATDLVYDMPAIPRIDGQPLAPDSVRRSDVCPSSG